jgi:DNA-binding transcriptional LysR family regulator
MAVFEPIDLRRVVQFVAVAEELHFGRAASRLYVSQPALSQAIRKLEATLGYDLLVRSSRNVELTAAGEVFLEEAKVTLAQADAMVQRAREAAFGQSGTLAVGFAPAVTRTAGFLITRFAEAAPHVTVDHRQEYPGPLVAAAAAGTLDVVIVVSQELPDTLRAEPLRDIPLLCAMDETHPLAGEGSIPPGALEQYPLAAVDSPSATSWVEILRSRFAGAGLEPQFLSIADPFGELPHGLRESNALWPLTPEYPIAGGVLLPIEPPITLPYDLVWRPAHASSSLQAFLRHARSLRDTQGWLRDRAADLNGV